VGVWEAIENREDRGESESELKLSRTKAAGAVAGLAFYEMNLFSASSSSRLDITSVSKCFFLGY
jgi:hypothetical protein